ncbi:hypothetical protein NEOKW01_0948 [Nematocida sp. AWRm80]|nr:hypothetical protein NEOKW01_0948 [Nematocida sp. AWRm80]
MHRLIQIVISRPPERISPRITLVSEGIREVFTEKSTRVNGRPALVSDGWHWLIFVNGIPVKNELRLIIHLEESASTLYLDRVFSGVTRYIREDFDRREVLPEDILVDLVVEEYEEELPLEHVPTSNSTLPLDTSKETVSSADLEEGKQKSLSSLKVPTLGNIPRIPMPRVLGNNTSNIPIPPAGSSLEKNRLFQVATPHPELHSLFPTVRWSTSGIIRGSIYERPGRYLDDTEEWERVEDEFKKRFCVPREKKEAISYFLSQIDKPSHPARKILSDKQEFLLSVVLGSLKKKGICMRELRTEIQNSIDTLLPLKHVDDICNLAGVFPPEKECILLLSSSPESVSADIPGTFTKPSFLALSETEAELKSMLENGYSRGIVLLAKYLHWAIPTLTSLNDQLLSLNHSFSSILSDRDLPRILLLLMYSGTLVNSKYSNSLSSSDRKVSSQFKGLSLSSISVFSKCTALDSCSNTDSSLLEFVLGYLKDRINLHSLIKKYSFVHGLNVLVLFEQIAILRADLNDIQESNDFPGKLTRVSDTLLKVDQVNNKLETLSSYLTTLQKKFAEPPDTLLTNLSLTITLLEKHSHLF